jgi:hypothetical protein
MLYTSFDDEVIKYSPFRWLSRSHFSASYGVGFHGHAPGLADGDEVKAED